MGVLQSPTFGPVPLDFASSYSVVNCGRAAIAAILVLVGGLSLGPTSSAAPPRSSPVVDVRGRLVPLGDRPLGPHRVTVHSSRDSASTVTTGGTFALRVRSADEVLRVRVDAASPVDRRFHPALFRAPVAELQAGVTVLMIPFEWTVQRGRYEGTTVEISMHEAFYAPEMALPPYLDGEIRDDLYRAAPARWDPADRPVPVPIRTAAPEVKTLTARDSASIWESINETEEVFGRDLFRPPTAGEYEDWEELRKPPDGALGVIVDTVGGTHECTGGGYRRGEKVWEWPPTLAKVWQDPPPAGYTADAVRIRSALNIYCRHLFENRSQRAVISALQHELLHALGFGHGCTIPSHMAYRCEPETNRIRTFDISPYDVAYWELREAVFDGAQTHDTRLAFLPALFGERALVRDLHPIPSRRDWQTTTLPVPPVPDSLTARVENVWSGSPRVRLDWPGEVSTDSRSYMVYRDHEPITGEPGSAVPLDTLRAWSVRGGSTFEDASVTRGEVYFYRITAFYADHPEESSFSEEVRVPVPRVLRDSLGPAHPATFEDSGVTVRASSARTGGTLQLAVSEGATGETSTTGRLPYGFALRADSSLANSKVEVRVQAAVFGNLERVAGVRVYRKSFGSDGSLEPLNARYEPMDDVITFASRPRDAFVFAGTGAPPVEIVRFEGEVQNRQVVLRWQTQSEGRGAGFEVQRRAEGRDRWRVVGVVEGPGRGSSDETYFYADPPPLPEADSMNYRLRLLRADGAASLAYSDVITVRLDPDPEASTLEDGESSTGSGGPPERSPGALGRW